MKGIGNDLHQRDFFSFTITPPIFSSDSSTDLDLFPPSYLESTGKDEEDFEEDKK